SARVAIPLSETRHAPAGARGASRSVVARSVWKVVRSRLLIPMTPAPRSAARSSSASRCISTRAESPSPFAAWKRSTSRAGSRIATMRRIASAPWARASHSWYSSTTKSFSSSGQSTRARTESRSARLPRKCGSVRTDRAAAPPRTYSGARATGSKPSASTPLTGDARLSSARTRIAPAAGGVSGAARLRGGARGAARSASAARGMPLRRPATSTCLRATISSRRPMASSRSEVAAASAGVRQLERDPLELLEDVLPEGARRWQVPHEAPRPDQGLQEVLVDAAARARANGLVGGDDGGLSAGRAAEDPLRAGMLAALRDGLALDLHDVEAEVEHRGARDRRPDPVGVHQRIEPRHLVLVDPAGGDDPHVLEAAVVELPADLLEDPVEIAPPR